MYRVFTEAGMVENFDQFFEQVYDRFRDSDGWILFPETVEVLDELKHRGLKIGVISNFDDRIYSVMRSLGILSYFDAVTISSETGYCKPDRRIFDAAMRSLNVPASQILLVGDSLSDDVEPAARAGLRAVLVDRSSRYASLKDHTRVDSLSEVLQLT